VIGGGLPVGAFAGPASLMDRLAPEGPVYQAGTLSGNPAAMAAGAATLAVLRRKDSRGLDGWQRLEELGRTWEGLVAPLVARECEAGHPLGFRREGSLFWFCFGTGQPPRRFDRIPASGPPRHARFFHALRKRGVMTAPSAFEVGFLNLAMSSADLETAAGAVSEALEEAR